MTSEALGDEAKPNASNISQHTPPKSLDATKTIFDDDGTSHSSKAQRSNDAGIKYIVFVGNMSYDVTADDLAKHMSDTCGEMPRVRLLTKKGDPSALEKLSNSKQRLSPRARHRIHLHLCPRVVRLLNFQMRLLCKRHFVFIIPYSGGGKSTSNSPLAVVVRASAAKKKSKPRTLTWIRSDGRYSRSM